MSDASSDDEQPQAISNAATKASIRAQEKVDRKLTESKNKKRKLANKQKQQSKAAELETAFEAEDENIDQEAEEDRPSDYLDVSLFQSANNELRKAKKLRLNDVASEAAGQVKRERRIKDIGPTEGDSVTIGQKTVQHLPTASGPIVPEAPSSSLANFKSTALTAKSRPVFPNAIKSASDKATPPASLAPNQQTKEARAKKVKTQQAKHGWKYKAESERKSAVKVASRRKGVFLSTGFVSGKV